LLDGAPRLLNCASKRRVLCVYRSTPPVPVRILLLFQIVRGIRKIERHTQEI
jgi:hypothetical protein